MVFIVDAKNFFVEEQTNYIKVHKLHLSTGDYIFDKAVGGKS